LLPAYTIFMTLKTLVASLQHFYNSENPSCQPTTFLQQ
jgi:hypothetical protein